MIEIPDSALAARQMYADGVAVAAILSATGLTRRQLYLWLAGGPKPRGGTRPLPPVVLRNSRAAAEDKAESRQAIVERIWRSAELQVREIERRLTLNQQQPGERERDARTLAVLVRTLRELRAYDEALADSAGQQEPADGDDDPIPRDIDEFRRELARRINAFVDERTGGGIPRDGGEGSLD